MGYEYGGLSLTIDDRGVADVVFNRPDSGNPVDETLCADINALSIELTGHSGLRVVHIRAEGKAFSFGGDLAKFGTRLDDLPTMIRAMTASLHAGISRLQRMDAPIIASVHGLCVGGMVAFVAGSDLVIAADKARFFAAYTGIGYSCDAGSSIMLPRRMGLARARRFFLMNETLDAHGALAAGLVDEVVAVDALEAHARSIVDRFAAAPTRAIGETRRLLLSSADQPLETQLELEAQALARVAAGPDAREGISAFLEKRGPAFVGN